MSQGFRDRWGIGWYKKTLNIEEKKKGKRYLLYFGGVYENAVLWVNGMKIGSHKYGYSSFKMDITDAVQSGDNELLMRVDNSVSPADRWYSGCGIYRDVTLLFRELCVQLHKTQNNQFSLQRERMECLPSILKMQSFGQQKIRIFIV